MTINKARITVAAILLTFISFSVGYGVGMAGFVSRVNGFNVSIDREVPPDKDLSFNLFWKVWDTMQSQYVDKAKIVPAQMVYGAIKGMVASAGDPYTVFLTPTENKITQEDLQGNFDGVGIQIGYQGTQLAVMAPLPNTPAERAGVRAGDYIVAIKDEKKDIDTSTTGMTLPEAVQIIRGQKGSKVTLTLIREGADKPIVVDLLRENIEVPSVVLAYVGEGEQIAHVKLLKFGGDTKNEWDRAVSEIIRKPGVQKIILDLRNNPGGYLQASVDIASDFMPAGSVVVMEEQRSGNRNEFKTKSEPRLDDYDVVVLVNKGSASASEILSGALRDQRSMRLIGANTFGKGTVQEPQQLEGGAGLHITIAKWLTPKGSWIHEDGLKPDIEIEDNADTTEDEQLQKAIETVNSI